MHSRRLLFKFRNDGALNEDILQHIQKQPKLFFGENFLVVEHRFPLREIQTATPISTAPSSALNIAKTQYRRPFRIQKTAQIKKFPLELDWFFAGCLSLACWLAGGLLRAAPIKFSSVKNRNCSQIHFHTRNQY